MSSLAKFDFTMPLTKVEKTSDGRLLFEGVASTTHVDKQRERMSSGAIEKMAAAEPVLLYPTHQRLAGTELGKTTSHSIRGGELYITGELFPWVDEAAQIYKLASEGLAQYEFSVGGDIIAAYNEFDKTTNSRVRVLDELALNHVVIASAGKAACPGTWMEVVGKTLDDVQLDDREEGAATVACETTALIRGLFAKAKADLAGTFGKVGSKHTAAERKAIHGVVESLHRLCDCADCTALIAELDGAAAETDAEAGKSLSFSENLAAREARSEGWYAADVLLWDLTDILSGTVAEIAGNPDLDVPAKVAAIELALGEFTDAVSARLADAESSAAKTTDDEDRTGKETPIVTLQEKKDRKAELEAELAQLDADIVAEEPPAGDPPAGDPPADPPAEEAPPADPPAADPPADEAPPADPPAADPPAGDPPAEEAGKTIADLQAQVAQLTATVEKLGGKPVPGGPASTAAGEGFNKTDDEPPTEDPFAKTVEQVETGRGTAAGHAAQRQANDLVAGSVMRQLGVRPQFAEGDTKGE